MNLVQQLGTNRRVFLKRLGSFNERSDFFAVQRYFEKIYALHYTYIGWRDRALWYLYRALYGLIYLTYVHKTYWVLTNWKGNLNSATNVLGVLWFFSAVILRVAILEWHYPLLAQLQAFLNDHSYQRGDPWSNESRSQFYRRSNRVTLAVMAVNFAEIVCFATTNVLTLEDFMLQYQGRIVGRWPLQIAYGVITMCWGATYCLGFLICYLIMATFKMEIDILLHSFEELGRNLRLQNPVSNLQKLKAIINPIAFVQYYSTYLVLADCCLILATGEMSSYSIVYVISMLVFLTEAYLLCRGVENLRNLKPRIAAALYDFDWTLQLVKPAGYRSDAQYRHVRRTFLLITAHSGQMIRFSFAGIGEISMNSFSELLEKSYSMLTFLLQFAK
uniref:Odorant receptor n=1 Tax=Anopheles atroparvus TaxID=41427 RepID=A0A182JCZ8_ANOAO